jgi:hypothetical protein
MLLLFRSIQRSSRRRGGSNREPRQKQRTLVRQHAIDVVAPPNGPLAVSVMGPSERPPPDPTRRLAPSPTK